MKTRTLLRACMTALVVMAFPAFARSAEAQISVIVSASQTKTLSEQQIAEIFAGASTTWPDGTKV